MAFSSTVTRADTKTFRDAKVTMADTAGNSGTLMGFHECARITIQSVLGGTAGTTVVQGSNDGTNWAGLPTAVSITTSTVVGFVAADLGFKYYRLSLSGGDGTTSHTFLLFGT